MRTITLKADDTFFNKVAHLAEQLKVSKSELMRQSFALYEEQFEEEVLKNQLHTASLNVRNNNQAEMNDFDATLNDGLNDV